jgi:hypothetical protein
MVVELDAMIHGSKICINLGHSLINIEVEFDAQNLVTLLNSNRCSNHILKDKWDQIHALQEFHPIGYVDRERNVDVDEMVKFSNNIRALLITAWNQLP